MVTGKLESAMAGWRVTIYVDGVYLSHKLFTSHLVAQSFSAIVDNARTASVSAGKILLEK